MVIQVVDRDRDCRTLLADGDQALAAGNIFVWSGNNYAVEAYRKLGRETEGGVRVGFAQYNTAAEVDRLLEVLRESAP